MTHWNAAASGAATFQQQISEALAVANVPTLILLLHQFTADPRWLESPFAPDRGRGLDDNDTGGLSEAIQEQVRAAAFTAIMRWRDGAPIAKPHLSGEELVRMMCVTEAESIPS